MYGSKVSLNQKESGHGHFLCRSVGGVINGILINVISFLSHGVFFFFSQWISISETAEIVFSGY